MAFRVGYLSQVSGKETGGNIWLREPSGTWGNKSGELNADRGKSVLNANLSDHMRNDGRNLGINLKGKSNLPNTYEEIIDVVHDGYLNEESPFNLLDGKKRPRLLDEEKG